MSDTSIGEKFITWAQQETSISAVVMIGSRVRSSGHLGAADEHSDWDFQVITKTPELFAKRDWTRVAGLPSPLACAVRPGRLGSATKMSIVFPEGAMDTVLIPDRKVRLLRWLLALRIVTRIPMANDALRDLSIVLRPGYRLLKGNRGWHQFFHRVASEVAPNRLDNPAVLTIADGYVCDYISARQKIARGEFLAAQRWLHWHLAEANFCLLHELKQREGATTFPDARRLEKVAGDEWHRAVTVNAQPDRQSLIDAVERSAATCRELVAALVGQGWRWPDLSSRLG